MQDKISKLHETYCATIGLDLRLLAHFERLWADAIRAGLTEEILRAVLLSRKKSIAAGKRFKGCLLLRNLIGSDEAVADLMNEFAVLEAAKRAFAPDPNRESVLRSTGRTSVPPPNGPKSVREVLESLKERS